MANNFTAQLNNLHDPWRGAAILERFMSLGRRQILWWATLIILIAVGVAHYYLLIPLPYQAINAFLVWLGAFDLILLQTIFYAQSKFNRFYFNKHAQPVFGFEVSVVLRGGNKVAKNLLTSCYGLFARDHLAISNKEWKELTNKLALVDFDFVISSGWELSDLAGKLYQESLELQQFLTKHQITSADFQMVFAWAASHDRLTKKRERWYVAENLERYVNLAASFRASLPPILNQYLRPIDEVDEVADLSTSLGSRHQEVLALEHVLGSNYRHNVLLQSHSQAAAEEVIKEFESLIDRGTVVSRLKGHYLYLLPVAELLSSANTAEDFIKEALHLFRALLSTSRLILVIDDLPLLLNRAISLKVSLPKLFKQILNSNQVSFIVLSHSSVEAEVLKATNLSDYFKTVIVSDINQEALYRMLWYKLWSVERQQGLILTVGAVKAIVEKAKNDPVHSLQDAALRFLSKNLAKLPAQIKVVTAKDIS